LQQTFQSEPERSRTLLFGSQPRHAGLHRPESVASDDDIEESQFYRGERARPPPEQDVHSVFVVVLVFAMELLEELGPRHAGQHGDGLPRQGLPDRQTGEYFGEDHREGVEERGSRELHILAGGVEQAESERGQRGHPAAVLAGRRLRKSVFFLDDTRRDAVDLHVGVSVLVVVFGGEILQSDRQQSRSRRHAGFSGHGRGEELRSQGVHRDEVGRDVARRGEHDDTQLSNGDGFGDDDDHQRDEHLDDDDVHQFGLVDDDGGQGYGTDHAGPDRSDNLAEALEHLTQFLRNQ
jgi:hypothetical protein